MLLWAEYCRQKLRRNEKFGKTCLWKISWCQFQIWNTQRFQQPLEEGFSIVTDVYQSASTLSVRKGLREVSILETLDWICNKCNRQEKLILISLYTKCFNAARDVYESMTIIAPIIEFIYIVNSILMRGLLDISLLDVKQTERDSRFR